MAKITNVTIINETTLRLEQDAKCGDEIDLLSLNQINQKEIIKKIEEGKDEIYSKKLTEEKKLLEIKQKQALVELENELKEAYNKKEQEYLLQINNLKNNEENLKSTLEDKVKLASIEEVQKLQAEISELKNKILSATLEQELKETKQKAEYKELLQEKESLQKDFDSKLEIALLKKEQEYKEVINEKEQEINKLKYDRTVLNSKHIGEDLEKWCDNEYNAYALTGFQNCTWIKDNIAIKAEGEEKGTKGDFVFRVFATSEHKADEELASVLCEMKSEDPMTKKKKTNASHYLKLDKDRIKKNCEYALLVSELEQEQVNDIPIRKVTEYEKMYVVRPQYFIAFLSIIESFGKKYQELLLTDKKEAAKFEKTNVILDKFNAFKEDIFDKVVIKIETEVAIINKQIKAIDDASDKIKDAAFNIVDKHLNNLKKKIEKFEITKINKAIDKLED